MNQKARKAFYAMQGIPMHITLYAIYALNEGWWNSKYFAKGCQTPSTYSDGGVDRIISGSRIRRRWGTHVPQEENWRIINIISMEVWTLAEWQQRKRQKRRR